MPNKKSKNETLSERIVLALTQLNISQTELARRIGVSQQAIQHICKNKLNYSKFTFEIASALNINIVWLATGEGSMILSNDPYYRLYTSQKKIPILSEEIILDLYQNNFQNIGNAEANNWILSDACNNDQCFAFLLKDKSMFPRFDQNSIIVVNPCIQNTNSNFVVAYIESANSFVFRQLIMDGTQKILRPINSTIYKSITLTDNDKIIGTVCETRWKINSI